MLTVVTENAPGASDSDPGSGELMEFASCPGHWPGLGPEEEPWSPGPGPGLRCLQGSVSSLSPGSHFPLPPPPGAGCGLKRSPM